MEDIYNPFKKRYPNREKVIKEKNNYAENLINEYRKKNLSKNLDSLNNSNKKLYLFINNEKLSEKETNFPEKFVNYGKIPTQIQKNLNNMGLEILTPIQKLFFGYLFNYGNII